MTRNTKSISRFVLASFRTLSSHDSSTVADLFTEPASWKDAIPYFACSVINLREYFCNGISVRMNAMARPSSHSFRRRTGQRSNGCNLREGGADFNNVPPICAGQTWFRTSLYISQLVVHRSTAHVNHSSLVSTLKPEEAQARRFRSICSQKTTGIFAGTA